MIKQFTTGKIISLMFFALGVISIFYLSWKSNPNVGELSFIPNWLSTWADQDVNNQIRTAVPFIGLGLLTGMYIINNKKQLAYWFYALAILIILVTTVEVGQYFLPSRITDIKDIIWGSIGACIGLCLSILINWVIKIK